MNLYRSILAFLASLSADPAEVHREPPRAAAAVAAAYATFAPDTAPPPPAPAACGCGGKCESGQYKPDVKIVMKCEPNCPCGCRKSPAPSR